jgi:two-component system, response regulator PdtaR
MARALIAQERDFVSVRLAAQLESLGHQTVGIVKDHNAAVAAAGEFQPDVMLLDQLLPPLDGIETARAVMAESPVPLVLIIGYPAAGLVRRAQDVGILAYLVWPAGANSLRSAVETAQARFRELEVLRREVGDLHEALRTRTVIGRAKTLLARRLQLGEAQAFGYLRRQSRGLGLPLGEVAALVSAADDLWFGKSGLAGCLDVILGVLSRAGTSTPSRPA